MNKIYNPNIEEWSTLLKRPTQTVADIETTVLEIFNNVIFISYFKRNSGSRCTSF